MRERERETLTKREERETYKKREGGMKERERERESVCVCMCVCVRERERERGIDKVKKRLTMEDTSASEESSAICQRKAALRQNASQVKASALFA